MCCILAGAACRLVCRNSVKLNFVKTGLKCKFGVNPQSFSHELRLYITRFFSTGGCLFTQSNANHVIGLQDERLLHIDEGQSVLDTGTCVLNTGGVCAPPQVRKLYK